MIKYQQALLRSGNAGRLASIRKEGSGERAGEVVPKKASERRPIVVLEYHQSVQPQMRPLLQRTAASASRSRISRRQRQRKSWMT